MPQSKNLTTVVDDIYETLSCLCDSEDLEIPDEHIEEFGERIKVALKNWSTPHKEKASLRMSIIGRPMRRLWYDLKNGNLAFNRTHPSVFIKFLYGHILEELVLLLVKLSGHEVEDEQKEIEVDGVKVPKYTQIIPGKGNVTFETVTGNDRKKTGLLKIDGHEIHSIDDLIKAGGNYGYLQENGYIYNDHEDNWKFNSAFSGGTYKPPPPTVNKQGIKR